MVSYPEGSREFTKLLGSGVGYGVVVGVGAFFAIAMSESSSRTRLLRASHVVVADGSSSPRSPPHPDPGQVLAPRPWLRQRVRNGLEERQARPHLLRVRRLPRGAFLSLELTLLPLNSIVSAWTWCVSLSAQPPPASF
mgnify:CR=1 FL=1